MAQKYKSASAQLDQFYTNSVIAETIVDGVIKRIDKKKIKIFLEPSAGNGAFSNILLKRNYNVRAFDLDPKEKYIEKRNFFDVKKDDLRVNSKHVCVIGNPPFGKNASLAVRFFNHCAELADTICFIVPKTFKKQSIKNRLNLYFKIVKSKDLPKNSFVFNGEPYDVPCVFQIWQKSNSKRKIIKSKNECALFSFVKKNENPDFGVRRVGGRAGTAFGNIDDLAEVSNHFCKIKDGYDVLEIVELINNINFSVINSTAGVRSLSKGELIRAIDRLYK